MPAGGRKALVSSGTCFDPGHVRQGVQPPIPPLEAVHAALICQDGVGGALEERVVAGPHIDSVRLLCAAGSEDLLTVAENLRMRASCITLRAADDQSWAQPGGFDLRISPLFMATDSAVFRPTGCASERPNMSNET